MPPVLFKKIIMKPLSVLTYYIRNKRKVIPIMAIIALSILGISVTAAILEAMLREVNEIVSFTKHYYIASLALTPDSEYKTLDEFQENVSDTQDKLNKIEGVDYIFNSRILTMRIKTIFGNNGVYMIFIDEENYDKFLEEMGVKLSEGRLPKENNELVIGESIMKNKNLKIGDEVGSKVNEQEWMPGKYKVVGILKSSKNNGNNVRFGIGKLNNKDEVQLSTSFLIHPNSSNKTIVDENLKKLSEENRNLEIQTESIIQKDINDQFASINSVIWAINIIVMFTITSSIALLQIIFFMQRANEFGLLAAIGYSRSFIIIRTITESILNIILGWFLGIIFSEIVYKYLNAKIYEPQGMEGLTILNLNTLLFTIPVPIVVTIFSIGTVLWKLIRMDPVAIIERRD
jgi:ABC-type lipoprotein release transport system permease subunit